MNRIALLISLALIFLVPGCSPGTDDSASVRPDIRAPVIGMTVPAGTFDAFYQGEITRIKLSDYRGKWLILFFYPADFSFVCPTELREMAEYYDRFRKAGAEVLAISTDSVYVHRAWHEQNEAVQQVQYPMLSDRAGTLSRALGTYVAEKGISVRASLVIDPGGIIIAAEFHDESIGRSAAELLRKLEAAVAVREHEGDFCPAAWNPGDEMITPK
jgi:alkyl hydroperoxide reductase subunit AhpC